jgi:methyl-accepting chemotaxis protein
MLSSLAIKSRVLLIVAAAIAGMLTVGADGLLHQHAALLQERRDAVSGQIDVATSLVGHFIARVERGSLSAGEAQAAALDVLRDLRINESEYFFVLAADGTMLMHPFNESLNGRSVLDVADQSGKTLFREMLELAGREGSGYVSYLWPKPGRAAPQPKVSFVRAVPQWGWVLGTGIYTDDVDAAFRRAAAVFAVLGLVLTGGIGLFALAVARGVANPLTSITERMKALATGDLSVDIPYTGQPGEIGDLARAVQVFKDTANSESSKVAEVSRRWNAAIALARTEDQKMQATCEVLTRTGGFSLVWIDAVDPTAGRAGAQQVALSAAGWANLDLLRIDWNDRGPVDNPTRSTLVSGKPFQCQDVANDGRLDGWRHQVVLAGHGSFASIPIGDGGDMLGVLNIYAKMPYAFSPLTLSLLSIMAHTLARQLRKGRVTPAA